MKEYFAPSELIINEDGSIYHLHLHPEHLADKVILVGDPNRVDLVASHFDKIECECSNREFRTARTSISRRDRLRTVSVASQSSEWEPAEACNPIRLPEHS